MDMDDNEDMDAYINFFFLMAHGTALTPNVTLRKIQEKKVSEIKMFEYHGNLRFPVVRELDNAQIGDIVKDPTLMYRLTQNPIESFQPRRSDFHLPPVIWTTDENDDAVLKNLFGFYHFILDEKNQTCILQQKIFDWPALHAMGTITWSSMFVWISNYLKSNPVYKDNLNELGIFSCRFIDPQTYAEYPGFDLSVPTYHSMDFPPYKEYTAADQTRGYGVSVFASHVPESILQSFDPRKAAIDNIRHQGCALNVLSFFHILQRPYAREAVACLSIKGTSIFKIVEILNHVITSSFPDMRKTFLVMRFPRDVALEIIHQYFQHVSALNSFIIVKMYTENTYEKNGVRFFSELGHTIAFMKIDRGLFLIDPQSPVYLKVGTAEYQRYISAYNWFDIIFEYGPSANYTSDGFLQQGTIRTKPHDLTFGGNKKRKRVKSKKRKRAKSKKTRKKTMRKYKKRGKRNK